jgi:hypothetical protein
LLSFLVGLSKEKEFDDIEFLAAHDFYRKLKSSFSTSLPKKYVFYMLDKLETKSPKSFSKIIFMNDFFFINKNIKYILKNFSTSIILVGKSFNEVIKSVEFDQVIGIEEMLANGKIKLKSIPPKYYEYFNLVDEIKHVTHKLSREKQVNHLIPLVDPKVWHKIIFSKDDKKKFIADYYRNISCFCKYVLVNVVHFQGTIVDFEKIKKFKENIFVSGLNSAVSFSPNQALLFTGLFEIPDNHLKRNGKIKRLVPKNIQFISFSNKEIPIQAKIVPKELFFNHHDIEKEVEEFLNENHQDYDNLSKNELDCSVLTGAEVDESVIPLVKKYKVQDGSRSCKVEYKEFEYDQEGLWVQEKLEMAEQEEEEELKQKSQVQQSFFVNEIISENDIKIEKSQEIINIIEEFESIFTKFIKESKALQNFRDDFEIFSFKDFLDDKEKGPLPVELIINRINDIITLEKGSLRIIARSIYRFLDENFGKSNK